MTQPLEKCVEGINVFSILWHHEDMSLGLPPGRDGSHCCAGQWGHITGTPKGFLDTQFQGTHYLLSDLVANVYAHGQGLELDDL